MIRSIKRDEVFVETYDLVRNNRALDQYCEDLDYTLSSELLSRLRNWLHFFNSKFPRNLSMYSATIYAVLDAAMGNHIFSTQTKYEFETSLEFYNKAIDSEHSIRFYTKEDAARFLNISLIYSRYSGLVSGSIFEAFSILNNLADSTDLVRVFNCLFVSYDSPKILIKHLNILSYVEIEALMFIVQGNNIRVFDRLPVPVSKKESFVFMNKLPFDLMFTDKVLHRALICSKLFMQPVADGVILEVLRSSKIFQHDLVTFSKDIAFWKRVVNLIGPINELDLNVLSVQEYVDFFEYKKYHGEKEYSLKGRTTRSVNRSIYEWHEKGEYEKLKAKLKLDWKRRDMLPYRILVEGQRYSIEEITNGKDLYKEWEYMKHCVFSYIEGCVSGIVSIWRLSLEVDSVYQPYVTIEEANNIVVQAAGKRNREITDIEKGIIEKWAEAMNYSMGI